MTTMQVAALAAGLFYLAFNSSSISRSASTQSEVSSPGIPRFRRRSAIKYARKATCSTLGCATTFFRDLLLAVEPEPAFFWTDFLPGTIGEAAD
jgi:membrane protein YqaA with SNARE-associated domain